MDESTTEKVASTVEATEEKSSEPSQDNVKVELEKAKKTTLTEADRAAFSLKKNAERLKALGGDPLSVLGVDETSEEDDDKPITRGMLKKMQAEQATKSALELADSISNEDERDLVKHYLQTRVIPSGNAQDDFKFALSAVSAVKNSQIAEEVNRRTATKSFSSATSAPEKQPGAVFTPTPEEEAFMRPPFNLKKEDIIKAREAQQ